jgi:phosphatidylinositol alpha-1,6-mannosyltransferase
MNGSRPRVAWLTNDLPPQSGGIQQFVGSLLERTATATTLVLGPAAPPERSAEAQDFDAAGRWRTIRAPGRVLPTPASLRWAVQHLREQRPDVIVIASLWPLGGLVRGLRRHIDVPVLGITHGAEAGLARGPGRLLLRGIARDVDLVTVISEHTSAAIGSVLTDVRIERLSPGVDPERFARSSDGVAAAALRRRWGVPTDATVVGCVARLVPRKGQDVLLDVWSDLQSEHGDARLVIVGEGPLRTRLERRASGMHGVHVVGPVTWTELPIAYAALDVFAMPVRTRLAGLDVEGLGISLREAQAAGLPIVAGRSGGAPETVTDPRCGVVVDGRDRDAVAAALRRWLSDEPGRGAARTHGPRVAQAWSWDAVAARFEALVASLVRR